MVEMSSFYAQEGTIAHALADRCLKDGSDAGDHVGTSITCQDYQHARLGASSAHRWTVCPVSAAVDPSAPPWQPDAPFTMEVTDEMAEAVQVYLDFIRSEVSKLGPEAIMLPEVSFDLSILHPDCAGTADAVIVQPFGKLLVIDYKHGAGHAVDATDNDQGKFYALGALEDLCKAYWVEEIVIVIVQPRAFHAEGKIRRWPDEGTLGYQPLSPDDLRTWGRVVLKPAAHATDAPDPVAIAGDHCTFCSKGATCKARSGELTAFVAERTPSNMSNIGLAEALRLADRFEAFVRDVRAHARKMAEMGLVPQGWKMVETKGNREWTDEKVVVETLKDPAILYDKPQLRSPAQLEKAAKAAKVKVDLSALITRSTGRTLVPETDGRPAIELRPAFTYIATPTP